MDDKIASMAAACMDKNIHSITTFHQLLIAGLFEACKNGNIDAVISLLDQGVDSSTPQDETLITPLMVAAEHANAEIVRLLLKSGAPWNAQDIHGNTAGEYAFHDKETMHIILNWAVETEMLLGCLSQRCRSQNASKEYLESKLEYQDGKLMDAQGEAVMMGWEAPLMARHAEIICQPLQETDRPGIDDNSNTTTTNTNNNTNHTTLDTNNNTNHTTLDTNNAVNSTSTSSSSFLNTPFQSGRILNVGFGLGIIDEEIQKKNPSHHTIIEAHPDVYAHMCSLGWDTKENVTVIFGRWQDVIGNLGPFDGIFYDTYGEYYEDMKDFHDHLPRLLNKGGVYSYFNGLAADNIFFHMVYTEIARAELNAMGFCVKYESMPIESALEKTVWEGVKNRYWNFSMYFVPICIKN